MENTQNDNKEPTVTSNSETATTTTADVVTSTDSPVADNAFQPFQQLHEAVLAAVNSHSGSLPSSLFSAVAAAAAANGNVAIHPQPFDQQSQQSTEQKGTVSDADIAKKESVRASNRERKKKWRLHNEERNKDNDLRCRVNKRANKLYGAADSPVKQQWINEEFEKRRQKRMEKDRRKHITNNALTGPSNVTNTATGTTDNIQLPDIVNNQMSAYYTPLPQIDTETAAKLLDFPSDLQRQLLEQLNNSMMALTNGMQHAAQPDQNHTSGDTVPTESHTVDSTTSFTNATENSTTAESNNNPTESINNNEAGESTTTAATAVTNEALQQVIAQGLSSSASTTENSNHNSPMPYTGPSDMEVDEPSQNQETDKKETEEGTKEEGEEAKGEKKQEYPMDAVLTLMQLNAGWRQ